MNRIILIILLLPLFSNAQKIAEDKIDEFTKHRVVRTTWEAISRTNDFWAHLRVSKIDSEYYFNLKFFRSHGQVLAVSNGAKVMLMLSNDSIISLYNLGDQVSCTGCGAISINGSGVMGLDLNCLISEGQYRLLKNLKVAKIRINALDGYLQYDIKDKFQAVMIKMFGLIE